ncbi:MAG TPA: putative O-glycosylation ligase, exosortase A system-associated [Acetobacteraceae bacterium]
MLRSLWLLFLYVSFLGLSVPAPFIATLGYVWVDAFGPQNVAYVLLNQMPVAMIMGAVAVGSYFALDRRSPPPLSAEWMLMIAMVVWVNLTMIWAQVPGAAWEKWDWAFKTLAFASFIPLVIRSRVQIEAFAQIYVFSLAANFVPFGVKTLISGGGYGANLGLLQGNSGLAEGGLLSTVCLMAVPLALHLSRFGQLIPRMKLTPLAYWAVAGLAVATAIGTYERSALIGLVALVVYMWLRSRHKFGFGIVAVIVACLVIYSTSSAWNARISTIGNFEQENSAYIRILVWRWTLEFTASHPLGGGFQTYLVDHIEVPGTQSSPPTIQFGRAFHSVYFEMLGEQGYPGLAMFLLLTVLVFLKLRRITKRARGDPQLEWAADLADALQSGLAVFMTCGAFVGIAFQPAYWYFVAMSVSLSAYMWRAENQAAAPQAGWRRMAAVGGLPSPVTPLATPPVTPPVTPPWRRPAAARLRAPPPRR